MERFARIRRDVDWGMREIERAMNVSGCESEG